MGKHKIRRVLAAVMCVALIFTNITTVRAEEAAAAVNVAAPSALLMESSTGQVIYEKDADTKRSPASITKIMTLLLAFESIEQGKVSLTDEVITSAHAKSMGGSQVFLEEGETQTLETMIKCITVASGNDASVAVAEHIAGSEEAFVALMNEKAQALGMKNTRFEDCCGLTSSDGHYTTARDVALMSRELTVKYPQVFEYTKIWMEDITHTTARGSSQFTLSSTNKLLKQYRYATGLKTGSTNKAKYCLSATASKDGIALIAVVMAAPDYKIRFQDAQVLLNYGFAVSHLYEDDNEQAPPALELTGGIQESVELAFAGPFHYLDTGGNDLSAVQKQIKLPEQAPAPVSSGDKAGEAVYLLGGRQIGTVDILYAQDVRRAVYKDYVVKVFLGFLL